MSREDISVSLREHLENRTFIVVQRGHGVYVEYTAPDGRVYLWYPRNGGVVRGYWGLQGYNHPILGREVDQVCFSYRGAVNPVTGVYNPNECIRTEDTLGDVSTIDSRSGDPFGLSEGRIPWILNGTYVPAWPGETPPVSAPSEKAFNN